MIASQRSDDLDTFIEEIEIVDPNWRNVQQSSPQLKANYTGAIRKNPFSSLSASNIKTEDEHLPRKFNTVVDMINKGFCVCVIMRGLPGSGKSFLAEKIIEETVKNSDDHILSADKFFMRRGRYEYDASQIQQAHAETQRRFAQLASQGMSPLIVDNTNVEYWHMIYYLQVAVQYGYHIEIMEPETPWKSSEKVLAKKNTHSVPLDTIRRMIRNYESGVSLHELLKSYDLEMPSPKKRNIPPLQKQIPDLKPVVEKTKKTFAENNPFSMDLIDFGDSDSTLRNAVSQEDPELEPKPSSVPYDAKTFQWGLPSEIYEENAEPPDELVTEQPPNLDVIDGIEDIRDPQETLLNAIQGSNRETKTDVAQTGKNKRNRKRGSKLIPHRKDCLNENKEFSELREFYPHLNETYLWDFFERCKGNVEWCANLLYEDNLEGSSPSGKSLTCSCAPDGSSPKNDVKQQQKKSVNNAKPASPANKQKKAKQSNNEEFFQMKEAIENSITIAPEYYPQHVNTVKNWKQGPLTPIQTSESAVFLDQLGEPCQDSPDIVEELQEVTISNEMILELDEEYGGGLLKHMKTSSQQMLPPKVFIKRSTAHLLYLEIMESVYSREEEAKLLSLKNDEEFAKKLSEQDELLNSNMSGLNFQAVEEPCKWTGDGDDEDFALKMSKEKLIKLFPGLNHVDLIEIFKSSNYNFQETVEQIKDSLNCSPEERLQIAQAQKKIFNESWHKSKGNDRVELGKAEIKPEVEEAYTSEHLKTVDDLRQEIQDHTENQKACYTRAREAIEKKNYELATYMSNIAKYHKTRADEAKHEVANMIAAIHEKTQASNTVLDLHYLNLVEASVVLEEFLDRNISRLRDTRKPYNDLFVITGRGKHSINGVASIKNKTKSILAKRGLR